MVLGALLVLVVGVSFAASLSFAVDIGPMGGYRDSIACDFLLPVSSVEAIGIAAQAHGLQLSHPSFDTEALVGPFFFERDGSAQEVACTVAGPILPSGEPAIPEEGEKAGWFVSIFPRHPPGLGVDLVYYALIDWWTGRVIEMGVAT